MGHRKEQDRQKQERQGKMSIRYFQLEEGDTIHVQKKYTVGKLPFFLLDIDGEHFLMNGGWASKEKQNRITPAAESVVKLFAIQHITDGELAQLDEKNLKAAVENCQSCGLGEKEETQTYAYT